MEITSFVSGKKDAAKYAIGTENFSNFALL